MKITRKTIRTGRDEYDYIQEMRARAQKSYKMARNAGAQWVGGATSAADLAQRIQKYQAWEEKYINPIKETRARLGAAAGSSRTKGFIESKISPSIVRYRETGARAPLPKAIGPEYIQEARGVTPRQQSSQYMNIANARMQAQSAGRALGKDLSLIHI